MSTNVQWSRKLQFCHISSESSSRSFHCFDVGKLIPRFRVFSVKGFHDVLCIHLQIRLFDFWRGVCSYHLKCSFFALLLFSGENKGSSKGFWVHFEDLKEKQRGFFIGSLCLSSENIIYFTSQETTLTWKQQSPRLFLWHALYAEEREMNEYPV